MLMLLSPAKSLIEGPAVDAVPATEPVMLDQTAELLETTKKLSTKDLRELMSISEDLATLNHDRFQEMSLPFDEDNARQAALMFDGDVYKGLDAPSLDKDDLEWAQDHVAILSGFYGVLRPLDLMQPYRLEMGTKLKTDRGRSLYAFWGQRITDQLNDWLEARGDDVVVNLASNEYFRSVKKKKLGARIVTPVFKDVKKGKARTISFYAKKARGAMVRWAIENRVTDAEELKRSEVMGYTFQPELSDDKRWVFHRPQPPPKS